LIQDKGRCPELRASFLSRILLSWVTPLTVLGNRKPLVQEDLWELRHCDKSERKVHTFIRHWKRPAPAHAQNNASLWRNMPALACPTCESSKGSILLPIYNRHRISLSSNHGVTPVNGNFYKFSKLFSIFYLELADNFRTKSDGTSLERILLRCSKLITVVLDSIVHNTFYWLQLHSFINASGALVPIVYRKPWRFPATPRKVKTLIVPLPEIKI